jgi:hypothetical protein
MMARLPAAQDVLSGVRERRRLAMALGFVAVLVLILAVAVPALPCSFPGGDRCPPSDDAIQLVPGDALAYVHVNLDPDSEQYRDASDLAARLPTLTQLATGRLLSRLPGPQGRPADFPRDVTPWFGGEAALAIVPAPGRASDEFQLLEASDTAGAARFARSIASGDVTDTRYRDVEVKVDARGLATAVAGGFLVIGTEAGVHQAIDAETGAAGARSLADAPDAADVRDALPDDRLADVYLSEDGIAELVSRSGGLLSQLSPFVDPGASRGVAAALVAGGDDLELAVRSVLDPSRARSNPGFLSAFAPFDPGLADALPSDSLGYVGIGEPGHALRSLLEQATAEEPGLAEAFTGLVQQLNQIGGVDVEKDLLPSLGDEAALALEPVQPGRGSPSSKGAPPPDALSQPGAPFLLFLASGVDEGRARGALARLEAPIAHAFGLQAPVFGQQTFGDVEAQSLQLSPAVDLTYAIFDGLLVIATDPSGVERAVDDEGGLAGSDAYRRATAGFPDRPSVLAYLDLGGLVSLAENAGLGEDPAYATFAQDLRRLEALGVAIESTPETLSTDARVLVSAGEPGAGVPSPTD